MTPRPTPVDDAAPADWPAPALAIHVRARHEHQPAAVAAGFPEPCFSASLTRGAHPDASRFWAEAADVIVCWARLHEGGLAHQAEHHIDVAIERPDGATWTGTLAPDGLADLTGRDLHDRAWRAMQRQAAHPPTDTTSTDSTDTARSAS